MKLTEKRKKKLAANFKKIFWIRAFMNLKLIGIVMSIFLISRGVTLEQIFFLAVVWSVTSIIVEIPSSYLADKWGRKKTIILGTIFGAIYWLFYIFAYSYIGFVLGTISYAISIAMFSGTTEALLYDSEKELGAEKKALAKLGPFFAARGLFKIITPIIAVFIAKEMTDIQFVWLISLDVFFSAVAFIIAMTLTEAHHQMDVEKTEAGVFEDALRLLMKNRLLLKAMFSRVLIFIAFLLPWHYYQAFFTDLGVSLVHLGFMWAGMHLCIYLLHTNIHNIVPSHRVTLMIDVLNVVVTTFLVLFLIFWSFAPQPYLLFLFFILFTTFEAMRLPLFSEVYNRLSASYNRATTISLASFLKSLLDIPAALIAGILVATSIVAPYIVSLVLCLIVLTFFRLTNIEKYVGKNIS